MSHFSSSPGRGDPTRRAALALLAALAVLAIAAAMIIASPAQAQIACPTNSVCLYEHINYGGRMAYYRIGDSDMTRPPGPSFNDKTSSIRRC